MANVNGISSANEVAAVNGQHTAKGAGVEGSTNEGTGVVGRSTSGVGVWGKSDSSSGTGGVSQSGAGVHGVSQTGPGVRGDGNGKYQAGVVGVNSNDTSEAGPGVYGTSPGAGVWGDSKTWHGVYGESASKTGGAGVMGQAKDIGAGVIGKSDNGVGVWGGSTSSNGVGGLSESAIGVHGISKSGTGVWGSSETGEGIRGVTSSDAVAAIAAHNANANGTGAALWARKDGTNGHAGYFEGRVFVSGDLDVAGDIKLLNADCAENFNILPHCEVEPGSVVRLTTGGAVEPCNGPYDPRVAGVISGAGSFKPGLLLDSAAGVWRRPVALFGKVYCLVDADFAPITVGDLLTTSSTRGHAMKAQDRARAFGAVLGKALASLEAGRGLIPILVTLN